MIFPPSHWPVSPNQSIASSVSPVSRSSVCHSWVGWGGGQGVIMVLGTVGRHPTLFFQILKKNPVFKPIGTTNFWVKWSPSPSLSGVSCSCSSCFWVSPLSALRWLCTEFAATGLSALQLSKPCVALSFHPLSCDPVPLSLCLQSF